MYEIGRPLAGYYVSKESRTLAAVSADGKWYYKDKCVVGCNAYYFRDEHTKTLQVSLSLVTDDGARHHVYSTDSELPTTKVPRSYRKHINQQLLEDINHG